MTMKSCHLRTQLPVNNRFSTILVHVFCISISAIFASESLWGTIDSGNRVVNGKDADYSQHPWAVYLQIDKPDNTKGRVSICGGTIINASRVITAAHCLQTKDKKKLATGGDIFMGFAYYKHATINNSYRVEFLEKNIEIHPNEDIDVAAIQFTDETPFKGDNVINITIPKAGDYSLTEPGNEVIVIGWGTMENGDNAKTLQEVNITVGGMASCSADELYEFCAGGMENGVPTDSCQGDSGGPVECPDEKQSNDKNVSAIFCGITSEGPTQCEESPGTYVMVAHPEVRWFVVGKPEERPKAYACRTSMSLWIKMICLMVAIGKQTNII